MKMDVAHGDLTIGDVVQYGVVSNPPQQQIVSKFGVRSLLPISGAVCCSKCTIFSKHKYYTTILGLCNTTPGI
jgi:hypothetical protein